MEMNSFETIEGVMDVLTLPREVRDHIPENGGGRIFTLEKFSVHGGAGAGPDGKAKPSVVINLPIARAGAEHFSSTLPVALQLNTRAARQLARELLKWADHADAIKIDAMRA